MFWLHPHGHITTLLTGSRANLSGYRQKADSSSISNRQRLKDNSLSNAIQSTFPHTSVNPQQPPQITLFSLLKSKSSCQRPQMQSFCIMKMVSPPWFFSLSETKILRAIKIANDSALTSARPHTTSRSAGTHSSKSTLAEITLILLHLILHCEEQVWLRVLMGELQRHWQLEISRSGPHKPRGWD